MEYKNTYSVIPTIILDDTELTNNEKILYAHIAALSNKYGYCFASNNYLASKMNVAKSTLKKWLKSLVDKKYIMSEVIYKKDSKEIDERRLRLSTIGGLQNEHTLGYDGSLPGLRNEPDNNISINSISINKKEEINKEEKDLSVAKRIIDYFNEVTGKSYKKIPVNTDLIRSRLKDYSEEELCQMIKFMYDRWGNDSKMCEYVRPSTLFCASKCENYVQMSKEEEKEVSDGYTYVGLTYEEQMKIIEQEEKERGKHYWED